MEQKIAALFSSVRNALDSSTYTYSDSDYLISKILVDFLEGENSLVASARQIPDPRDLVESVINYVISTEYASADPDVWYSKAASIVVDFADFAYRNEISEDSAKFAALLPEGHPRSYRVYPLTASAHREALAAWMAADPRLDDDAAEAVYSLYSQGDFEEVEAEYKNMKLEALAASGRIPEDVLPLVAAFNMSRATRSAISKALAAIRRRDRDGRFAEEFGRLKLIFGFGGGRGSSGRKGFFSKSPRTAGPGRGPNSYVVEFDGSDSRIPEGLYEVDAAKGENIKAYLPKSVVEGLKPGKEVVSEEDKKYAINLDEMLATKMDAPPNWEKSGKGFKSKDGKLTATPISSDEAEKYLGRARERGDDVLLSGTGAGDDFDPENPKAFLIADDKGRAKGIAQDWAGIQEISVANGVDLGEDSESNVPSGRPSEPITPENLEKNIKQDDRVIFRDKPTEKLSKESLSDDMLGEGYNLDKDSDTEWSADDPEGGILRLSKFTGRDGKERWELTREYGDTDGSGQNLKTESLGDFDNKEEAFEFTADRAGKDWDQEWVDELLSDQDGPDLNQDASPSVTEVPLKVDRAMLESDMEAGNRELLDEMDQAVFDNDLRAIERILDRAANDYSLPDEVYSTLYTAREAIKQRGYLAEDKIYTAGKEELEEMLNDDEFSGWHDRIQDAIDQYDTSLDQDAPTLSEKQMEPATGKQYALLKEIADERQMDPATEQAFTDALENKNLNKAQAGALINSMRNADFKDGVDPNKPSQRMLDSLQGYLATKDLTPTEIKNTLDSVEADPSRANVDALLNNLRRKKDKPVDLNQGSGSLIKYGDDNYEWEDVYNNVSVQNGKDGWEVDYTNPDLDDRGGQVWQNRRFDSEEKALAFAEELIRQNQDDSGYGRAAEDMGGIGLTDADLDQDARGTLEDSATDKQWEFLDSLLNGKKIDNPELSAAVRSALEERNLTKGEVGAFIGQLRPLADKPNVRREPTAKQLASIRRGLLERELTREERRDLEDRLTGGLSFDEASEILNDLKSRDITAEGMNDLVDEMVGNQDLDGLKYLLTKPEYADYTDAIRDAIQTLRRDQGTDQDFDPDLDIDLNQSAGVDYLDDVDDPSNWSGWDGFPEYESDDGRLSISLQGDPEGNKLSVAFDGMEQELDDETENEIKDILERINFQNGTGSGPSEEEKREAAEDIANLLRSGVGPLKLEEEAPYYESVAEEVLDAMLSDQNSFGRPRQDSYDSSDGRVRLQMAIEKDFDGEEQDILQVYLDGRKVGSQRWNPSEGDNFWTDPFSRIAEMIEDADDVDLNQDAGRSISRDDIVDSLADELDKGYENRDYFVNGDELQTYVDEFDSTTNPDTAGEMAAMVYDMSNSVRDPELGQRLRDLSARLDEELADRFGIGQAARYGDGRDSGIDLDNVVEKIRDEKAAFFETDTEKIADFLDDNEFYGDVRSNGAEARVTTNDDGTYTAEVEYDRGGEEQTFNDRDEALAWAADKVSDYNDNARPSSYVGADELDLEKEASDAKSPEQAVAFADRLDEIADDIENNRGDERVANSLREYGERIRDLIAKRERNNQSQVPDEPTTPETTDEMARDRNINSNAPEDDSKKA